jgi:hypothetical protein
MPWYTISTAEITEGKTIDAELLNKMMLNSNQALSMLRLREAIPNPSFELATGTVPLFWEITTDSGGNASISTGCHGANSLRFSKSAAGAGGGYALSEYFPLRPSMLNTMYYTAWASSTLVVGMVRIRMYDKGLSYIASSTAFNGLNIPPTPTTASGAITTSSSIRFGRVEIGMSTASSSGTLNFDELYFVW